MKKNIILLILIQLLYCQLLDAQTWNGNSNNDWNTPENWTPATVPTASGNVIIPGGLSQTKYPVLASDITIRSINMQSGSQIDFNGRKMNIISINADNYFTGATLNNSDDNSDIIININSSEGNFSSYLRSTNINDNIIFNLSGTNSFNGADDINTANTYAGNASFYVNGALVINLSNGAASQFKGDLNVIIGNLNFNKKTSGEASQLFNSGAMIAGNFSYSNSLDAAVTIGNISKATTIGGKVDIYVKQIGSMAFNLYHLINNTPGGNVTVQNTDGFDVQKNTLKINSFNITGYRGNEVANFFNNDIGGNLTIDPDISKTGAYRTYIRSNIITGTTDFVLTGPSTLFEADTLHSGNHFMGDFACTISGKAYINLGNGDKTSYDGNVTINRTADGATFVFKAGASIVGNFSLSNDASGIMIVGDTITQTDITGKINLQVNNNSFAFSPFKLQKVVNQTPGGIIRIKNSKGFTIQKNTLLIDSMIVYSFVGSASGFLFNNEISGNIAITTVNDTINERVGGYIALRSNLINGNADFIFDGDNGFVDADIPNSGNHYTGNVSYTELNQNNSTILGNYAASRYDGNLTVIRAGNSITGLFIFGGGNGFVGGDFSFTGNSTGSVSIGNKNKKSIIEGKIDLINSAPTSFVLNGIVNKKSGGNIILKNSNGFDFQNDTLKITSLSITNYKGNKDGLFYNNAVTGDVTISDNVSAKGNIGTYLRLNYLDG
ncbi:MAG: hypothetical protein ABI204_06595, partial [Ginsengibacter sp.]